MPRNYHCLVSGLPEITIDQNKLSYTQLDFKNELKEILHPDDYQLVELFYLNIDNKNLLAVLTKSDHSFIEGGKYTKSELEDEIKDPLNIKPYMLEFINAYKEETPLYKELSWENQLTTQYYKYITEINNVFLKEWFSFELQLKNIFTALNCRKHSYNIEQELIQDNAIVDSLIKSTAKDFGLSSDVPFIEKIIQLFENDNIQKREYEIDLMKWEFLDDLTVFEYFTIEKVISYLIKLGILERWIKMDVETG